MKKLINWTCGSFFRTLGRFAFYILIGYILSCLINFKDIKIPSLWDVYAESITPNYGIDINSNNFDGYIYLGNSKDGIGQNARIEIYQDSINALDYNFIIIDVCATNDIKVSRTASVGNSCTNSCFSNAIGITKTTLNCKSNGYDGNIYRVNGSILKWYIGSGSSSIYSLNDQITLVNDKSNNVPISIYGVYISDTENIQNMTIDYTQNFNNVINNQNQNTQDIINNQNQSTQDIIDNQNANSQAQIDSQKVCERYDKDDIEIDNKAIAGSGTLVDTSVYGVSKYINVNKADVYITDTSVSYATCFYNINKTLISCTDTYTYTNGQKITLPNNTYYIRTSIWKDGNRPNLQVCKNGNQAMNDVLTDSSSPDLNGLNNSAGWLPAGPVDSILNLPLSFLTNLNTNLSKSCTPVTLTLPYVNRDIELPCLNSIYAQINGLPTWLNSVGIIASAFILFSYLINLYKYIDDTLTFRENNYIDNWSGV